MISNLQAETAPVGVWYSTTEDDAPCVMVNWHITDEILAQMGEEILNLAIMVQLTNGERRRIELQGFERGSVGNIEANISATPIFVRK